MENVLRGLEFGAAALAGCLAILLLMYQSEAYAGLLTACTGRLQDNPVIVERSDG